MIVVWTRFIVAFALGTLAVAVLTGLPTDVIPNGWYSRMTPVQSYSLPVLVAISILSGVLTASYWGVRAPCSIRRAGTAGATGAVLGWFAIGCPVCNKLVILALGASGALTYFAPLQPWLAALSIMLLLGSIAWRWRTLIAASQTAFAPEASPQGGAEASPPLRGRG